MSKGKIHANLIAVHRWKPEDQVAIMKEALTIFKAVDEEGLPEGIELCATYINMAAPGAFCVWKACCKEKLEGLFSKYAPNEWGTGIVPVVQSFPPTTEYILSLWKLTTQTASK